MLTAVNHLSSMQSHATQNTMLAADRLLNYAAQYPHAALVYRACDMILHSQSDASFQTRPKALSVAGCVVYLGNKDEPELVNAPIYSSSTIIPNVMPAVSSAEYAAAYLLSLQLVWLRTIVEALGYKQPPTIILCDNQCAVCIANKSVKLNKSKYIHKCYHYVRDQVHMKQIEVKWARGVTNLADFFTKALSVQRHKELAPLLVTHKTPIAALVQPKKSNSHLHRTMKGCIETLVPALLNETHIATH
jgi:hypothetical protein